MGPINEEETKLIALIISPLYVALNLWLLIMLLRWMGFIWKPFKSLLFRIPFGLIFMSLSLSMGIAFLIEPGWWQKILKYIGNVWIGVDVFSLLILLPIGLIWLILILILKKIKKCSFKDLKKAFRKTFLYKALGLLVSLGVVGCTLYGVYHGEDIQINPYSVTIDKDGGKLESLDICLIADIHMGYNVGVDHVQKMVDKINALNPDIILIAGDIFDNEYEAMYDPEKLSEILSTMESKYGVYSVYGNHDIQEKILAGFTFGGSETKEADPRMDQFVKDAGFIHLRDEVTLVDNSFYIIGRADEERPGKGIDERASIEELMEKVDDRKPVIVLDHEPKELIEQSNAGVDLCLNGHVHDGQIFPGNLLMQLMWDNSCGQKQFNNMQSIVTSGVGIWGPPMRIGTDTEICMIHVDFK